MQWDDLLLAPMIVLPFHMGGNPQGGREEGVAKSEAEKVEGRQNDYWDESFDGTDADLHDTTPFLVKPTTEMDIDRIKAGRKRLAFEKAREMGYIVSYDAPSKLGRRSEYL